MGARHGHVPKARGKHLGNARGRSLRRSVHRCQQLTRRTESSGLGKKAIIWIIGLAALAGLTALSFNLANEVNPAETLPAVVNVEVTGQPLAPLSAEIDPTIGAPGHPKSLRSTSPENRQVLSTMALPRWSCSSRIGAHIASGEVPVLQDWIDENGIPDGVDFVSVATRIDSTAANYPPNAWLERENWTQRVVMDDELSTIANSYGLSGFPFYVLLDGAGNVVQRIGGELGADTVGVLLENLAVLGG